MQGPSELGASGKLVNWSDTRHGRITVPTLAIGARYDTNGSGTHGKDGDQGAKRALPYCPKEATLRCTTTRRCTSKASFQFVFRRGHQAGLNRRTLDEQTREHDRKDEREL